MWLSIVGLASPCATPFQRNILQSSRAEANNVHVWFEADWMVKMRVEAPVEIISDPVRCGRIHKLSRGRRTAASSFGQSPKTLMGMKVRLAAVAVIHTPLASGRTTLLLD